MTDSTVSHSGWHATPIDTPLERSLYVGNILQGILYGVEIFTFFAATYCIRFRPSEYRKSQRFYVFYGGVLLILVTIEVASRSLWGQYMWIDHRNYPGGPLGYYAASESSWYNVLGIGAGAMANTLGDGLLLHRCYIIWGSRWYILILPILIYLASSVFAIITVVESAFPDASMLNRKSTCLAVPWVLLSVSLNIIVTSMICFRLLRMRALTREVLSPEMSCIYSSIVAMLIESAAPLSILGIGLVVSAAQKSPIMWAFGYVWSMFCSLSPQMIILRVAMGCGWRKESLDDISTALVFAEPSSSHEESQGVRTTTYNTEGRISGPATKSDTTVNRHGNTADAVFPGLT